MSESVCFQATIDSLMDTGSFFVKTEKFERKSTHHSHYIKVKMRQSVNAIENEINERKLTLN